MDTLFYYTFEHPTLEGLFLNFILTIFSKNKNFQQSTTFNTCVSKFFVFLRLVENTILDYIFDYQRFIKLYFYKI